MELLELYKQSLLQDKRRPSEITVKNYLADVRKFVRWFEDHYKQPFFPYLLSESVSEAYKKSLLKTNDANPTLPAVRSTKRYMSSLKKFCDFLLAKGMVNANPFSPTLNSENSAPVDPWFMKEFQNYLVLANASRLTIKNYVIDIKQFLDWATKISHVSDASGDPQAILKTIDTAFINEYKNRLTYDAKLSPASINRKLSSLRKYLTWVEKKGVLHAPVTINQVKDVSNTIATPQISTSAPQALETLKGVELDENEPEEKKEETYSSFGPLRFIQKLTKGSNHFFDLLLFVPIVKLLASIKYNYWKASGRTVFAPVETVVKAASGMATGATTTVPTKAAINIGEKTTIATQSILDKFIANDYKPNRFNFSRFPKSMYAPLKLSLKALPLYKRILHHIRYTRPNWYKKYHSYRFVHYLHFAIVLVWATVLGLTLYQAFNDSPRRGPVIAALPDSPPRLLAFSGTLTDAANTPIAGDKTVRFALYDSPTATGSSLLWQETQSITTDVNGKFSTSLGQEQPLRQKLLSDNPGLYLGMSVGSDNELQPRQQIATTKKAKDAERVQGLAPITQPNAGTTNVLLALDSAGNLNIGGSASPTFEATGGQFTIAGKVLRLTTTEGSNTNVEIAPDGNGIIDLQKGIQNTTNYSNLPGVQGAVSISDSVAINATENMQSALTINQNANGNLISASRSGVAKFAVSSTGNGMFAGDVAINGNELTSKSTSFNLFNQNVLSLNIGQAASAISLGATTGRTTINNSLFVKGTANFEHALSVQDNISDKTISQFTNMNDGSDADGVLIKLGNTSTAGVATGNHFIDFATEGLGVVGSIQGNGNKGIQLVQNSIADWAEYMKKNTNESIPFGSVVCMQEDGNATACREENGKILGVSSENPTILAGQNNGNGSVPVGLTGLVKTLVSTKNGAIKPGDMIASSTIAGVGAKATKSGMIVGRALEGFDKSNELGTIVVSVHVSWFEPEMQIADNGNIKNQQGIEQSTGLNESIITYIKSGIDQIQNSGKQTITILSDNALIGSKTLHDYIAEVVDERIKQNTSLVATNNIASQSALTVAMNQMKDSLTQDKPATNAATVLSLTEMLQATASATLPQASTAAVIADASSSATASPAANLATKTKPSKKVPAQIPLAGAELLSKTPIDTNFASLSGELSANPDMISEFGKFNQGIIALGASSLTDVSISGIMQVGETMTLADNSINTIGANLEIQPLRQGDVSFMSGLVTIDTEGSLSVSGNASFAKDVTVKGILAANIIKPVPDRDLLVNLGGEQNRGSSLKIQDGKNGTVLAINNKGDLTASGTGKFKDLAANVFTIVRGAQADTSKTETSASASAGVTTITAKQKERTVFSPFVKKDSLIYITATSDTQGLTPYVARQTAEDRNGKASFTIQIPSTATKDIKVNWWIVN